MNAVLQHLRQASLLQGGGGLTDRQLLERFLTGRDEDAFAALVRRHGPMVLSVCRRVLSNAHDAEDAFQATFLVLVRKAAALPRNQVLGAWLYSVAYRTSLKARTMMARRRARERRADPRPADTPEPEACLELLQLLDQELNRLPDKYRVPVVLCELQGRTRTEAARQLAIPPGTLSSRLARARKVLAGRLSRRGVVLSGGALALPVAAKAATPVPALLVLATARIAARFAAGRAAGVSTTVILLTEGVLKTMFLSKLRAATIAVLVAGMISAGGIVYRSAQAQEAQGKPRNELDALRRENELLKLNVEVLLEKVRSQEAEIKSLKPRPQVARLTTGETGSWAVDSTGTLKGVIWPQPPPTWTFSVPASQANVWNVDGPPEIEQAMKAFREAPDKESRRRTAEALEKALQKFRKELK
jgi:RNA polymerase sigma factor (sigma-70 family)